jgi:hypothetical protein
MPQQKPKLFSKIKHIKSISRATLGIVPRPKIIPNKKQRDVQDPKYKPDFTE